MEELQNEVLKKFKELNKTWASAVSDALNKNEIIDLGTVQEKSFNVISEIPSLFLEARVRMKKGKKWLR